MKKSTFIAITFLGIVSAMIAVLGPIHEFWHWLVSALYGTPGTMGWGVFYLNEAYFNLPIIFSGFFGEVISLTAIFLWLFHKGHFHLSAYIMGYMASFTLVIAVGFIPIDVQEAYKIASENTVNGIYLIWKILYFSLLSIQLTAFMLQNRIIFGKTTNKTYLV